MTSVVQTNYSPQQRPAVAGMIADQTDLEVGTWLCETAAGIGYGLAVSQGSGDKGAILGGSKFLGVTLKDITLIAGVPVSPNEDTVFGQDIYARYTNMGVATRGRVWVVAGSDVAAQDAAFYSPSTGGFSNSASGLGASGIITFSQQPVVGQTVTIKGVAVTFIAADGTPSGNQVPLGNTLGDTLVALAAFLNASADADLSLMGYQAYPSSPGGAGEGSGAYQLIIAADAVGTAPNAYTIATNVTGATVSAATLAGGTASATAITGAFWRTSALAGQLAILSLGIQR